MDKSPAIIPPSIELTPIDARARNGRPQLVFSGEYYSIVSFADDAWRFPNGVELDFAPTHYRSQVPA